MTLGPHQVYCATVDGGYGRRPYAAGPVPELPPEARPTPTLLAVRKLLADAGLDRDRIGSAEWNPLSELISPRDRVLVKPNWVHHRNASGWGLDCLVTHTDVIEAALWYVAKARPAAVALGDAPVQGCDFEALMAACGVRDMLARLAATGVPVALHDFRRTVRGDAPLRQPAVEGCRPLDRYVLHDLGTASDLEPITRGDGAFRVAMYDPEQLARRHGPGRHQYLVAREAMEADVVVNLPKLKTHKKACLTGALKNVVGINGHKEYLPHHRRGGSRAGGDCYEGRSRLKEAVERLLDSTNRSRGPSRPLLAGAARAGMALSNLLGAPEEFDGSWPGNDTVWRMTLDLQRILRYGRAGGGLASVPQRVVLTLTDAVVCGQGNGPLAPEPAQLGLLTLGTSTAAVEWVHAQLMGLDPRAIPLVREAFAAHRYPLAPFAPAAIAVRVDGRPVELERLFLEHGSPFRLPRLWQHAPVRLPAARRAAQGVA